MSLVIGYGNRLRTDDAIGPILAEALGGTSLEQLYPELAEPISQADTIVFIDACYGEKSGQIQIAIIEAQNAYEMSHQSNPATLLQMAKELYGSAPPALLISITGASFEIGDNLSSELQIMLPRLIQQLQTLIQIYDKLNDLWLRLSLQML